MIRIQVGRSQTSWLFTKVAHDLQIACPISNHSLTTSAFSQFTCGKKLFNKISCLFLAPQDIIIHFRALLINVSWEAQLGNKSSETFRNLSSVIENSVSNVKKILESCEFFVPYKDVVKGPDQRTQEFPKLRTFAFFSRKCIAYLDHF